MVSWSGPQVGIPLGPYVIVRLLPMEERAALPGQKLR
jgi:hypothetical protein